MTLARKSPNFWLLYFFDSLHIAKPLPNNIFPLLDNISYLVSSKLGEKFIFIGIN